jgi:hypothetical protein
VVQNTKTTSSVEKDSKETLDGARKCPTNGSTTGVRRKPNKPNQDRSSHASSRPEPHRQKEGNDAEAAHGKVRQSQSPAKSTRSANKTPPKHAASRPSTSEKQSTNENDTKRDIVESSDHSPPKGRNADTNAYTSDENAASDAVSDHCTGSNSHDLLKSPTRRRLSMSQSVHSSPVKKLGKGSSTGVTRRQRLLASTFLDDEPGTLSNIDNHPLTQVSKQSSEPSVDGEKQAQRSVSKIKNGDHQLSDTRPVKNLSRSMHVSSPRKKVGNNTEISVRVNLEKSKMQSRESSSVGIDIAEKKSERDSKPANSTRARKTTCEELKKELAAETVEDDPIAVENVGRRRRNSIGMPIKSLSHKVN